MPETLFYISSAVAIVSALGVVFSWQAIQSVLWMFALLIGLSGLMVYLGAYLIGLLTMLVYAGAILVLFAFVVMFMGQRPSPKRPGRARLGFALMAILCSLFVVLPLSVTAGGPLIFTDNNSLSRTVLYGPELFARYQVPAQLAAWILLWVAVGAFNALGAPASHKKEVA